MLPRHAGLVIPTQLSSETVRAVTELRLSWLMRLRSMTRSGISSLPSGRVQTGNFKGAVTPGRHSLIFYGWVRSAH